MILERYIFREVGQTLAAVLSVLLLVYLSHRFVRYLADAAAGKMDAQLILQLLGLKMVGGLGLLLPLALYLAVLLALGRMHRDSEITALAAGGIGQPALLRAVFLFALGFALVQSVLSLYVAPRASLHLEELEHRARAGSDIASIAAGRFTEFGGAQRTFYAEDVAADKSSMTNIFVAVRGLERTALLSADSATQVVDEEDGGRFLVVSDGTRYDGTPGAGDYRITQYHQHAVRIGDADAGFRQKDVESIATFELLDSREPRMVGQLQWRLSLPISSVVLALLAVVSARSSPRQSRALTLLAPLLMYFIYSNLLGVAKSLVEKQLLTPAIGLWSVHAVMLVYIYLITKAQGPRWRLFVKRWRRRLARS